MAARKKKTVESKEPKEIQTGDRSDKANPGRDLVEHVVEGIKTAPKKLKKVSGIA